MKKLTSIICIAALLLSLTACAQNKSKENKEMKKTLVAYFSATGTTKRAAEKLAKEKNADLFEIVPAQPYTVSSKLENLADYDTVWIGFPVWWYTAPTIVNTFIDSYDFSGKVLCVFATSGGSGVEGSAADLKKAYPQYQWGESKLLN